MVLFLCQRYVYLVVIVKSAHISYNIVMREEMRLGKISESIKKYRKKHNLSQSDFAKRLHVTKQAISKWETGRGYPDPSLIPVIAKELGISIDSLMGENRNRKSIIIIGSIVTAFIIALLILIPMILHHIQDVQEYRDFKIELEEITKLELPNKGSLKKVDFEDWIMFGNTIPLNQMSYIIFTDGKQADDFENTLVNDSRWLMEVDDFLLELLPANIQDYTTIGDYYLLFNMDTDAFNDVAINNGEYHMYFLVYQNDNNRLIVFDYFLHNEGGN